MKFTLPVSFFERTRNINKRIYTYRYGGHNAQHYKVWVNLCVLTIEIERVFFSEVRIFFRRHSVYT